jgi:hypothetical protein
MERILKKRRAMVEKIDLCKCENPEKYTKVVKAIFLLEFTQDYCQNCNKPITPELNY